jgi:hypothetical protein
MNALLYSKQTVPIFCINQHTSFIVGCVCRYLFKNLGVKVCDSPLTVRLLFEPSGRVVDEVGQYYTQEKANHCVVCGNNESYIRKNIVPREYRRHFPGKLSIKLRLNFVMLFTVGLSHDVHDPFHFAFQSGSVRFWVPLFFLPFHICSFVCDISQCVAIHVACIGPL